jgi:diguanylate cyclase (GGDEF)-like protein
MASGQDAPRELNNSMTGVLLSYVRRVGGDRAVDQVLRQAGETRATAELEDPAHWSTYEQTRQLFAAAALVTEDPGVGRKAGEELFSRFAASEVVELLRSLERPSEVLRVIAEIATKQSAVTTMECVEADEFHAVVSARTTPLIRRDRMFCDYTSGVLAAMSTVFGMALGSVAETECQTRGDKRCLYQVTWDPDTATDAPARVHFLTAQVAALATRFEALEAMASELASVGDVDAALRIITERAAVAIRAPRFLVAVQLPREHRRRVHGVGFEPGELNRRATEVLMDTPDDRGGARLIVDVASSTHHFGRIAAFHPEGRRFLPEERRLFEAYAGHAAAALATAAALDEARERARTIGALFDLATTLSEVGTVEEVADRLARALPDVADCDEACVFVWEPDDALLICQGRSDAPRDAAPAGSDAAAHASPPPGRPPRLHVDPLLLDTLTRDPRPCALDKVATSGLADVSKVAGFETGVVVPVVARGRLFGLVAVSAHHDVLDESAPEAGRDRLEGIARIAATAFDNARLLDQIRHQAGHDPLTGLPNSRLLEELFAAVMASSRRDGQPVAMMFVDLDYFKNVNDERGHHVGDALLAEVGQRLRVAIRSCDTAGRLGGDEFAILMPGVGRLDDLEAVAKRILSFLEEPVAVAGTALHISASIGIALATSHQDTFEALLRRADAAMYEAKAEGRARYCFHN